MRVFEKTLEGLVAEKILATAVCSIVSPACRKVQIADDEHLCAERINAHFRLSVIRRESALFAIAQKLDRLRRGFRHGVTTPVANFDASLSPKADIIG